MDEANPCYSLVMQFMSLFGWAFPCSKFYIKTLLYLQDNTFAPVDIVLLSYCWLLLTLNWTNSAKHSVFFTIYLFEINNGNTRVMCQICSKLTIKMSQLRLVRHTSKILQQMCKIFKVRLNWRRSSVFIVNIEQTSLIVLVFPLLTLGRLVNMLFLLVTLGKYLLSRIKFEFNE